MCSRAEETDKAILSNLFLFLAFHMFQSINGEIININQPLRNLLEPFIHHILIEWTTVSRWECSDINGERNVHTGLATKSLRNKCSEVSI